MCCRTAEANYISGVDAERGPKPLQQEHSSGSRDTLQIVAELNEDAAKKPIIVFCMRLDDTYELSQSWISMARPSRIEVDLPDGADIGPTLLSSLEHRTAFHNAELTDEERELVERQLDIGEVDVVFSTTTLAAGVNFPLGSAVFDRFKRWNSDKRQHVPISRAEFHNMAGRVGRMGQVAAEGTVLLVAENRRDTAAATALMNFAANDDLTSRIQPDDFGQLVLHIFAGRLCSSREAAYELLIGTYSAARELNSNRAGLAGWHVKVDQVIDELVAAECLVEAREISVTMLGAATARTGLKPATVLLLLRELFDKVELLTSLSNGEGSALNEDSLSFVLAHAALTSPEFDYTGGRPTRYLPWRLDDSGLIENPVARQLEPTLLSQPWTANPSAANGALLLAGWVTGSPRSNIERLVPGIRLGKVQAMGRDAAWILAGIADVIQTLTVPHLAPEVLPSGLQNDQDKTKLLRRLARTIRRQSSRFVSGLPPEVVWLTRVEQPGPHKRLSRKEILALRAVGLTQPRELMSGDPAAASARAEALRDAGVKDGSAQSKLRDAVRSWKAKWREFLRKAHERQSKEIDGGDLARRLYDARGHELESVLEEAFGLIDVSLVRLDDGSRPGSPDFLITIEALAPIVVEVKSKQNDTDFVGFNSATEILSSSEILGYRESPCLTICSPAVDPSIAGLIENCHRLSLVDVTELFGAILRVHQKRISLADLHNWLTTPGIATFEDLTANVHDE